MRPELDTDESEKNCLNLIKKAYKQWKQRKTFDFLIEHAKIKEEIINSKKLRRTNYAISTYGH